MQRDVRSGMDLKMKEREMEMPIRFPAKMKVAPRQILFSVVINMKQLYHLVRAYALHVYIYTCTTTRTNEAKYIAKFVNLARKILACACVGRKKPAKEGPFHR